MPRKSTRGAKGGGSIRKRSNGVWEGRYTYTDEFGIRKNGSVYSKSQAECQKKLNAALAATDNQEQVVKPSKQTLESWLDTWMTDYCQTLKPMTQEDYRRKAERYIIPTIGAATLSKLTPMQVQRWVNQLSKGTEVQKPLAAKTVKNIHGILHSALKQAVLIGLLKSNPADNAKLPKLKKPELKPLMDEDVSNFLKAIKGHRYEYAYLVDLFTGLRQSELLGLKWEDVDWEGERLTVRRQLQKEKGRGGKYYFVDETKNGKDRIVPLAPSVIKALRSQQAKQTRWQLSAGELWCNEHDLIFTDEIGQHLSHRSVYHHFKKIVTAIGCPEARFHDLRHSCAILELQAGVPVKSVQEQLGHYSSAFTMDVYAAVSETMMEDTRNKLEKIIKDATG